MSPHRLPSSRRGLTLIEASISIVIVAVLITAVLGTFGSLAKARQLNVGRNTATGLANQLLSEVVQNVYLEPSGQSVFGPEPGEAGTSRALFDDVDDYHNWTESPPMFRDGSEIPGLASWTRTIAVEHIDPNTMAPSGTTDRGLKRISVAVIDPRSVRTAVVALRSKTGVYDVRPASQTACVGWVGVELQIGSDSSTRAYSGANVLNVIPAGGS